MSEERFHVELRKGFRSAAAFNLSEHELHARFLDPWQRSQVVELGGREWDPAEAELTVLAGPALAPAELGAGQGWSRAQRRGRVVTGEMIAASALPPVAVLASGAAAATLGGAFAALGIEAVAWAEVREHVLAGDPAASGVRAVAIAVGVETPPEFELGLAIGAYGHRALLARVGPGAVPPLLEGLEAVPLEALAARLRQVLSA